MAQSQTKAKIAMLSAMSMSRFLVAGLMVRFRFFIVSSLLGWVLGFRFEDGLGHEHRYHQAHY